MGNKCCADEEVLARFPDPFSASTRVSLCRLAPFLTACRRRHHGIMATHVLDSPHCRSKVIILVPRRRCLLNDRINPLITMSQRDFNNVSDLHVLARRGKLEPVTLTVWFTAEARGYVSACTLKHHMQVRARVESLLEKTGDCREKKVLPIVIPCYFRSPRRQRSGSRKILASQR